MLLFNIESIEGILGGFVLQTRWWGGVGCTLGATFIIAIWIQQFIRRKCYI